MRSVLLCILLFLSGTLSAVEVDWVNEGDVWSYFNYHKGPKFFDDDTIVGHGKANGEKGLLVLKHRTEEMKIFDPVAIAEGLGLEKMNDDPSCLVSKDQRWILLRYRIDKREWAYVKMDLEGNAELVDGSDSFYSMVPDYKTVSDITFKEKVENPYPEYRELKYGYRIAHGEILHEGAGDETSELLLVNADNKVILDFAELIEDFRTYSRRLYFEVSPNKEYVLVPSGIADLPKGSGGHYNLNITGIPENYTMGQFLFKIHYSEEDIAAYESRTEVGDPSQVEEAEAPEVTSTDGDDQQEALDEEKDLSPVKVKEGSEENSSKGKITPAEEDRRGMISPSWVLIGGLMVVAFFFVILMANRKKKGKR